MQKRSQPILPFLNQNPNPRNWIALTIMKSHLSPWIIHHLQILQPATRRSRTNKTLKSLKHFITHVVGIGQRSRGQIILMGHYSSRRRWMMRKKSNHRTEPWILGVITTMARKWTIIWSFGIGFSLKLVGRQMILHFKFRRRKKIWKNSKKLVRWRIRNVCV